MKSLDELHKELATASQQSPLNINRIIEITNDITRLDPDYVRFSTDAGIISRLGKELVAKEETAVAELIKNSYDADATSVSLTFIDATSPGGTLIIEDNGLGMTREQLIDGFMRLSSSEKINVPQSKKYKRSRAGRKGIGRFAVQRLGTSLTIITQTEDSKWALQVDINWESFSGGKDLGTIANRINKIPKQRSEGTTLTVHSLREGWRETSLNRVYRYVAELIQPYPLHIVKSTKPNSYTGIAEDVGFKVELYKKSEQELQLVVDEQVSIFSYALAKIEGYVDKDGYGYWSIDSTKIKIDSSINTIGREREGQDPFVYLRDISFSCYYFIVDNDLIPRAMITTIRHLMNETGGIRMYRNGFRVPPYGAKNDDWLRLDESSSVRKVLPPHRNANFFGFVEIIDPEGEAFEETSSREGLLENATFEELRIFCYRVLIAAVLRIGQARGRKTTRTQKDWKKPNQDPAEAAKEAAKKVKEATDQVRTYQNSNTSANSDEVKEEVEEALGNLEQAAEDFREAAEAQERQRQELLHELGMLRVLASLGLYIGEFTHEVRQTVDAANINSRLVLKALREVDKEVQTAEDLRTNIQSFITYASYFDQTVSDNASRELQQQDLRHVVRLFASTVRPSASKLGISVETSLEGYDLLTPEMHVSELSSLLLNLYTNAQKAIQRAKIRGKILLRVGEVDNIVFLEIADNGDGIPEENKDRIFNAFFTTSTPIGKVTSQEELQGTGLGLKIVRDIVESYGGEISLTSPPVGFITNFRVEFPSAKQ